MQLEDYFEFETCDTKFGRADVIRIKGSRIMIEVVIEQFLNGEPPNRIQEEYPTLSLEEVYATLTYYLHNREAVDQYMERGRKIEDAYYQEWQQQEPPPVVKRIRELLARQAEGGKARE